jgi:8-oxo-dGTP diphosphatase
MVSKEIVAGLITKDGQLLIDQRLPGGAMGGLWELPGGKLEPGETPEMAVAREITEELGIEVRIGPCLAVLEYPYPQFLLIMRVYHCPYVSGTPQPLASQAIRWVSPAELSDYIFPEANTILFTMLTNFFTDLTAKRS